MSRDLTLENFLTELGSRVGATAVVVGLFFALGYVNRTGLLGLSAVLDDPLVFFAICFLLVGLLSLAWIGIQRYRS